MLNSAALVSIMAAFLGGSFLSAILGFIKDRQKNRLDAEIGRLDALQAYNSHLLQRIREVETDLDTERKKRREAEEAQIALESRVAELERGRGMA